MPQEPFKTALLLPGLDALFATGKLKRWLQFSEIRISLDEASKILSSLTGQDEDLLSFVESHHRIHIADFDRTLVCLTAVQVAIADKLKRQLNEWDLIQGCSHGDIARSVLAESITFAEAIDILWTFAVMRKNTPEGYTANVRSIDGSEMSKEQLQWLEEKGAAVSRWSESHATVGGTTVFLDKLKNQAKAKGLKIKPVLPYPIHSPAMQESFLQLADLAPQWNVQPPNQPIFSSLWLRYLESSEDIFFEGLAGSTSPVKWVETLTHLYEKEKVRTFINVGPSNTLTGWLLESQSFPDLEVIEAWDLLADQIEIAQSKEAPHA